MHILYHIHIPTNPTNQLLSITYYLSILFTTPITGKLPINKQIKDYEKTLLDKYEGTSSDDLKTLACIENKDKETFDYFYPERSLTKNFFTNTNVFDEKMSQNEKADYLVEYLSVKYRLLTPTSMRHVFRLLGLDGELGSSEYPEMMVALFGKENLDLSSESDKEMMRNFIKGKESSDGNAEVDDV